jgi:hypothetical protein
MRTPAPPAPPAPPPPGAPRAAPPAPPAPPAAPTPPPRTGAAWIEDEGEGVYMVTVEDDSDATEVDDVQVRAPVAR